MRSLSVPSRATVLALGKLVRNTNAQSYGIRTSMLVAPPPPRNVNAALN